MYGILGLEQMFLRFSFKLEKNVIETQQFTVYIIIGAALFSTLLSVVFVNFFYSGLVEYINPPLFIIATLASVSLLFLFNIFRLNEAYTFAQVLANLWKIILFVFALLFLILKNLPLAYLLNAIAVLLILSALLALLVLKNNIKFKYIKNPGNETILKMAVHFFISISCFSALLFGDRFIVEYKYGLSVLGDYFYLTNLFIAPFSILQSYVGFKQLVFYKTNFEVGVYKKMNLRVLFVGILLALLLFVIPVVNSFVPFLDFKFNLYWKLIVILLITGVCRLYSASINAAFEATTNLESLKRVNMFIVIITTVVFVAGSLFLDKLEYFASSLLFIWLARSYIQNHYLLRIFEPKRK
jgi:hypothetical protein